MFATFLLASALIVSYEQKESSIEDAKTTLAAHGSSLESVALTSADDALMQIVKEQCPNLKAFSLHRLKSSPKVKTKSLSSLIQAKTLLTKLDLAGFRIKPPVAHTIGNLATLVELRLEDCSLLGKRKNDYKKLLLNLKKLQMLSLGKCEFFSYRHCRVVATMPLRELAIDGSTWMFNVGLKTLCDSKTLKKSLRSLTLSNAPSIDEEGFGPLQKLSLKKLRLQNCLWFNDRSLKSIMQGKLINSLENLELEKVSVIKRRS